ncbi:glycoside hydrolase [Fomitiporia mediterranea MF3/22]|uniref:glycoside hydrolase n=1 Tax=Fomitiporia mediterranea (strain MF3/22) TaxID=694068 RepID=UPI0004408716|nr:glycoside hydrolase [Fomitiporia mediterranea MF3/22]EJD01364.1 glycoside hydrolase [Fomitiporia mediterranea MF3/22]
MAISEEVKRQIGQHFVFGFEGYEPNEHITKLIRDYYVGIYQGIPQLHNLIQRLQQLAKDSGHAQPLLIGIDQENGLVSAFSSTSKPDAGTQFPGAMAVGSTGDPENARKVSNSSGREMHLAGISWAYSPVADVNSDIRNPVIGVRSYGEDARAVSSFVCALSDGYVSAGIASCAKHFPGHGDTHVDSHLALPVVTKDLATLEQTELVPFQDAIANGIPSIMTGHIALPPLIKALGADKDERVPASLSRGIVTILLREKMGFKGVVVTDCFEMNAISKGYGIGPGAVLALQADTDIVMCCHVFENQVAAVETTYTAVERGDLGSDFLRRSGERIAAMKEKFCGKWEDILGKPLDTNALSILKKDNERISREIYARTSKWLSRPTDDKLLYISPHSDVLVLTPQMESINAAVDDPQDLLRSEEGRIRNTAGPSYLAFATAIARRAPFSSHIVYTPLEAVEGGTLSSTLLQSILSVHAIVFATRNAHQSAWQLAVLRRVVDVVGKAAGAGKEQPIKIIVVASCAPYDHALLQADEATKALPCLCTYEFTKPALEEAATKLYGEKFVE